MLLGNARVAGRGGVGSRLLLWILVPGAAGCCALDHETEVGGVAEEEAITINGGASILGNGRRDWPLGLSAAGVTRLHSAGGAGRAFAGLRTGKAGLPGLSANGGVVGDGLEEDEELGLEAQPLGVRSAGEGGELECGEPGEMGRGRAGGGRGPEHAWDAATRGEPRVGAAAESG